MESSTKPASSCPFHQVGERHQAFEHEGMYDFFADIRPDVRIFHSPEIDYWVVTHQSDIKPVLQDSERFSATIATKPLCPWPQSMRDYLDSRNFQNESVQVACDPPKHTRIRNIAARFLNIRQFHQYEDDLRALVVGYLDQLEAKGENEVDLVEDIFYEFPAQAVFLLLGVKDFDPRKIKEWGDLRIKTIFGRPSEEELNAAAEDIADFWDYSAALVESRVENPGDDYPSVLLKLRDGDDEKLTMNELRNLVFGLQLAGHETTTNAAGNLFLTLMKNPDQWQKLVDNPSLITNAVEEGLRFASSVVAWRRIAKQEVVVAGKVFPAGTKFLLSLASGNHDDEVFEDPEVFDVSRQNPRRHIAFGNGLHTCLGAPLARLELKILLEELTKRFPNMELVEDQEITWIKTLSFRGPNALRVRLNK